VSFYLVILFTEDSAATLCIVHIWNNL